MFDIAWSEWLIVLIVAILVIGPKELPAVLRTLGQMLGKLRRSAEEFRRQFDDAVREAGGEDLHRELRALQQHNPLNQIRDQIEDAARDAQYSLNTDPPKPKMDEAGGPSTETPALPASAETGTASAPETAPAMAADTEKPAAPQPTTQAPKDGGANGASHELRVNGEHRPT
jgi:sec-independent protein translocase protein TatB